MRIFATILLLLFVFSCKSLEKQRRQANNYFNKYPGELATKCNDQFPVKDSIGDTEYIRYTAPNENYQSKIDSLSALGDKIITQLVFSKAKADSISNTCADVVISYMWDIERLNRQVKELSKSYRPCNPDTLKAIQSVYRRSLAYERILADSLDQYKYQLGILTDQSNLQVAEIDQLKGIVNETDKEKGKWMWRTIFTWIIAALVIGALTYMYIKK